VNLLKGVLAQKKCASSTVTCDESVVSDVATKTDGFSSRDLNVIVDRAVTAYFIHNQQHVTGMIFVDSLQVSYVFSYSRKNCSRSNGTINKRHLPANSLLSVIH
jgi:hypothetical protein